MRSLLFSTGNLKLFQIQALNFEDGIKILILFSVRSDEVAEIRIRTSNSNISFKIQRADPAIRRTFSTLVPA